MNKNKEKIQTMFGWLLNVIKNKKTIFIDSLRSYKVFLKFWEIPALLIALKQELEVALRNAEDRKNTIEYLLIKKMPDDEYHFRSPFGDTYGKSKDELYKECIRDVFDFSQNKYGDEDENRLAYISIGGVQLPKKYLTDEELKVREDIESDLREQRVRFQ